MDLSRVDLNLLVVFEALWLERSVTRAAMRLNLAQPSVSNALKRLRLLFDDELFVRTASHMEPTALAKATAPQVLATLQAIRHLLEANRPFDPATARQTFTIATGDYIETLFFAPLVQAIGRQAPGVDLRFLPLDKTRYQGELDRGLMDVVVGIFNQVPKRFAVEALFEDHFVMVARRGHPALGHPLTPEVYAGLDHVLVTLSRDAVGAMDQALGMLGLSRRVVATISNFASAIEAVLETDLVVTLPQRLAVAKVACVDLVAHPLPFAMAPWTVEMVWRRDGASDPGFSWLQAQVRGVMEAH
ncbi:MAG: LysR family transcriptional regulator [Candidatus Competibacterales bacterium]